MIDRRIHSWQRNSDWSSGRRRCTACYGGRKGKWWRDDHEKDRERI